MRSLSTGALSTCLWHCQKRWSFCRSLLVAKFLRFNLCECAVLKNSGRETARSRELARTADLRTESFVSSPYKSFSCPGKELDKNRQILPPLWRRRLCSDRAQRHQVPFEIPRVYLLSTARLHGLCCRSSSGDDGDNAGVQHWPDCWGFCRSCRRAELCNSLQRQQSSWVAFGWCFLQSLGRLPRDSGIWSGSNKHTAPLRLLPSALHDSVSFLQPLSWTNGKSPWKFARLSQGHHFPCSCRLNNVYVGVEILLCYLFLCIS